MPLLFYGLMILGSLGALASQYAFYVATEKAGQVKEPIQVAKNRRRLMRLGLLMVILSFLTPIAFISGVIWHIIAYSFMNAICFWGIAGLTLCSMVCKWVSLFIVRHYFSRFEGDKQN